MDSCCGADSCDGSLCLEAQSDPPQSWGVLGEFIGQIRLIHANDESKLAGTSRRGCARDIEIGVSLDFLRPSLRSWNARSLVTTAGPAKRAPGEPYPPSALLTNFYVEYRAEEQGFRNLTW